MRIIIVEDKSEKAQEIMDLLKKGGHLVDHVFCVNDFTKRIRDKRFEIAIIDLKVPNYDNEEPSLDNGCKIVQDLYGISSSEFYLPKMVFVISEYLDEKYSKKIESYPISIIKYTSDGDWKEVLNNRLDYIGKKEADVVILTAVEREYDAVKRWDIWNDGDDVRNFQYQQAILRNRENDDLKVVLLKQQEMGMVCATDLAGRAIRIFNPRLVIMCGICAGRHDGDLELGDIVVARSAWDYGSGSYSEIKQGRKAPKLDFSPAPSYINLNLKEESDLKKIEKYLPSIKENLREEATQNEEKEMFGIALDMINHKTKLSIGSMATGAAVIKSSYFTEKYIKAQNRKYSGIDMETYGVYYAAKQAQTKPDFFAIKSIVDKANSGKDDSVQDYCARLSADFVKCYLEKYYVKRYE